MERFVGLLVAGGLALVCGLWIAALLERGSAPWLLGVALSVAGTAGLAAGIVAELDVGA